VKKGNFSDGLTEPRERLGRVLYASKDALDRAIAGIKYRMPELVRATGPSSCPPKFEGGTDRRRQGEALHSVSWPYAVMQRILREKFLKQGLRASLTSSQIIEDLKHNTFNYSHWSSMPVSPRCASSRNHVLSVLLVVSFMVSVLPVAVHGETGETTPVRQQPLVVFETPPQQVAKPTDLVIDTRIRFVVCKPQLIPTPSPASLPADTPRLHLWVDRQSCSCTSIDLESDHFMLGETGVMHVHFAIGHFHGLREIDCAVHAALPGSPPLKQDQTIVIQINVPELIAISPQHLEWGPNDTRVKTMTFTSLVPNAVLSGNDPIDPAFLLVPEQCLRTPTMMTLALRPVLTDRRTISTVSMHALLSGIPERPCIGYLAYFPVTTP